MNEKYAKSKFIVIHIVVLAITAACLVMNGPMRGGLPLDNTLQERMSFIAQNGTVWTLSWCLWMVCAIGLFVFCTILADELKRTYIRTIGLAIVAMGIGPDLIAEVIYAFIMPAVIHNSLGDNTFELLEITATHLTGYLGNGLYNIGGLILTLLAIREGIVKNWVAIWGITAWLLGLMLSLSIALGSMKGAEIFTASSMVLSTLWMLVFAYKVVKP